MNVRTNRHLASACLAAALLVQVWAGVGPLPALAFASDSTVVSPKSGHALSEDGTSTPDSTATVSAPCAPRMVTRGASFVVTGTLAPRHDVATATVSVDCLRLQSGRWIRRTTATATLKDGPGDTSVYSATIKLPYAGRWRLRARHADAEHASTASAHSRTITSAYTKDAIVWDRDGVTTIPERMRYRRDSRQMVVVTGKNLDSHNGTLQVFEYRSGEWVRVMSAPARFGRNALVDGLKRRSGTRTTPTGIWRLPNYVFGQSSAPPSGTKMAYRDITRRSWWSAERNSTYNTWVETSRRVSGEHLIDVPVQYEFALSSGYNARPNSRVFGRGTAIFIHCYGRNGVLTGGCVAISRTNMIRLFRTLDSKKRPVCAIGTTHTGTATAIYSY